MLLRKWLEMLPLFIKNVYFYIFLLFKLLQILKAFEKYYLRKIA